jgi:pyruvate/2-oxoglutarate dehydrogenase complex dihydrolipoamide dehydrogenase (E3) component/uncharacterized membrane protein YdjX (TVP38/TMEM64 family)
MKKLGLLLLLGMLVALYLRFDPGQYLDFGYLKSQQQALQDLHARHPLLMLAGYFLLYVVVTALSLPGAAVMTLAGGAIFGLWSGLLVVSFASSIGATLAFLASRYLLRDRVQRRFAKALEPVNRGIEKDGAFYLFALRLVPAFPFFIINLVMGLTPIRSRTFYWVSQLGMLPGTLVYVNAGTQLARIQTPSDILSLPIVISFSLLALLPFLARALLRLINRRRALRKWRRPRRFDANLVVIGGGSAGLVTAYIAAAVKARVVLIEKNRMGGDCLNTGCVPSKALIRSARVLAQIARSEDYGIRQANAEFGLDDVMQRVRKVIGDIAPHDSIERYTKLGVDVVMGEARIIDPWTVRVGDRRIRARNIVVATGARPIVPPIEGIETIDYLTSDNLWSMRGAPGRLLILGGGPIGCELAQAFARLGVDVGLLEMAPRLLMREDPEVSQLLERQFAADGVRVLTGHRALRFIPREGGHCLVAEYRGAEVEIPFDRLLVAVGRQPNSRGFGLKELGVRLTDRGAIEVDAWLRSSIPTILACGDVAGPYQFTHVAAHQAWYASVNALFGLVRSFKVDYSVIPWATFVDPEVARVGLNEQEARERGIEHEVTRYDLADLDRAIADGEARGFVKVITAAGRDRILGVTFVGAHAGDLIAEFVLAMKQGTGLNKLLDTIHIYPTWAEANRYVAGEWKRAHAPARALRWLARFHRWRRGRVGAD